MATTASVDTRWFQDRLADKRLSQRKMAARRGLDPAAVSLLLRGKREVKVNEAAVIAQFLGADLDEVLDRLGATRESRGRVSVSTEKPRERDGRGAGDWEAEFMRRWIELGAMLLRRP